MVRSWMAGHVQVLLGHYKIKGLGCLSGQEAVVIRRLGGREVGRSRRCGFVLGEELSEIRQSDVQYTVHVGV